MSPDSSNPPPPVGSGSSVADLKLVDEPGDFETLADAEEPASEPRHNVEGESPPRGLPIWMFVVGLIIAVVVIGWQAQLAGELEAEVAGLERRLERSNALLEAHRSHLGEVRGGVYDLSERLEGLRALVDTEPGIGPTESAPQTPQTPPTP